MTTPTSTDRINYYARIHKAVRLMMGDLSAALGRTDFSDDAAVEATYAQLQETVQLLEGHAQHEDVFVVPLVAKAAPELGVMFTTAHVRQEGQLEALLRRYEAVAALPPEERQRAGNELGAAVSRVIGELLTHMADEEELAMPALWRAYSDAELLAVEQQLLASIPPEEMARWARWLFSSLSPAERLEQVSGARANMPPPVFEQMLGLLRSVLSAPDFSRLVHELGVRAAA